MVRAALSLRRLPPWGLAIVVGLALTAPAHAQWKWRDAKGQVHISDTPPPRDVPEQNVLQRPAPAALRAPPAAPAASAPPRAASAVDPELEERKRRAEQEQAAKRKADDAKNAAIRKDNCQRARDQLAMLDSGQRVMRIAPNGEREYLSDEQRAQEAQRARSLIASECR